MTLIRVFPVLFRVACRCLVSAWKRAESYAVPIFIVIIWLAVPLLLNVAPDLMDF